MGLVRPSCPLSSMTMLLACGERAVRVRLNLTIRTENTPPLPSTDYSGEWLLRVCCIVGAIRIDKKMLQYHGQSSAPPIVLGLRRQRASRPVSPHKLAIWQTRPQTPPCDGLGTVQYGNQAIVVMGAGRQKPGRSFKPAFACLVVDASNV